VGEEFEAVVSGVTSFGFFAETILHKCEGLVSINSLFEYDDFRLIEGDYSLVGMRSGRRFRMGDKVTIKVISANLSKRQLDYEWVIATSIIEDGGAPYVRTQKPPKHQKPDRSHKTGKSHQHAGKRNKGKRKKKN